MKMIVKAIVKTIGTMEIELPNNFDDIEIKTYIKDNADMLEWKDIEIDDIDYNIKEEYILEDDEKQDPEDNTYSGGVIE